MMRVVRCPLALLASLRGALVGFREPRDVIAAETADATLLQATEIRVLTPASGKNDWLA